MCTLSHPISTAAGLRRSGVARHEVQRRLDAGVLLRARRGVFAASGACDLAQRAAAHGGRLTCVTAARHLGLWVLTDDDRPHVWLRDGQRSYHRASDECACVEHWGGGPAGDPATFAPVAHVLRHLFDCQGIEGFFVALESARRHRLINATGLQWLREHSNARLREALDLARDDADSGLESLLRWRLRHHGLVVRTQVEITGVGRVDALIGDRLIIETDGAVNHDGESLRHKDLVRDANAAGWGYITLRFDYAMIVHDWELVERAILGALAGAAVAG